MITINNKIDCCGCTACASVCSHNAITMEEDALGFLYPRVDVSKCTNCGLCEKVCQFSSSYNRFDNFDNPTIYLGRLKDDSQLQKSQSGGLFYILAKDFILNNGVVYGASFNEKWHVTHQKVTDLEGLESLRMSKYVQSDMRGVFQSIKKDLIENKHVLFSGTPCQVSGLKSYVPLRLHSNLFCIDIVCHCVPSPKIWKDYIAYLEDKNKGKIVKATFRDKRFGWHGAKESFLFEDGSIEYRRTSNTLFFKLLSIRESCTNCPYTNTKRVGDITLGDFWGLPKDSKYEKDNKGVSLILVNSEKGNALLEHISNSIILEEGERFNYKQPQLRQPVKMNPLRQEFIEDYTSRGFKYIAYKYSDCGWRYKKDICISMIKTIIKKIIRR